MFGVSFPFITLKEVGLALWVGIEAIRLSVAEARAGFACGCRGGGGGGGGCLSRFGWGGGWRRRKLWMIEKEKKELRLKPEQFRRRCWCILKWQNKFLTDFQNLVQVLHERMFSLSAELSIEVIQVEGPDEGTAKLLFLQILDLRRGQRRNQFDFLSTNKQKYTWPLRIQNNYLDVKAILVVKSNPFIAFHCIRNFLIFDPVETGTVQETTNLEQKG